MTAAPTLLVGKPGPLSDAINRRLRDDGADIVRMAMFAPPGEAKRVDAIIIVQAAPQIGAPFLDIDDVQLDAGLDQFLDLFGMLAGGLPLLNDGGVVLLVGSRGHLGAWGGAHEMAFAGAAAGLMRSVALENMARGVRANVIATGFAGSAGEAESDPDHVAELAAFLLSPAGALVNGELILANGGRSLQMREARDRRAPKPSIASLKRNPT